MTRCSLALCGHSFSHSSSPPEHRYAHCVNQKPLLYSAFPLRELQTVPVISVRAGKYFLQTWQYLWRFKTAWAVFISLAVVYSMREDGIFSAVQGWCKPASTHTQHEHHQGWSLGNRAILHVLSLCRWTCLGEEEPDSRSSRATAVRWQWPRFAMDSYQFNWLPQTKPLSFSKDLTSVSKSQSGS